MLLILYDFFIRKREKLLKILIRWNLVTFLFHIKRVLLRIGHADRYKTQSKHALKLIKIN